MTSNIFSRFGKSYGEVQTFNSNVKNSDYFTSEFEINDAPVGARNLLTKGLIQDEINHYSGAAITTRGRFISKSDHQKNSLDRPLFLYIQGPTKQSIEMAIQKIHEIIRNDIGNPIRQGMSVPGNISRQVVATPPTLKPPPLMGVSTNVTQVEKLYIGLDGVPASFDLRGKIIGPSGSNLHYIRSETGAAVTLRGQGSQFMEAALGREGPEPLHLFLEHPRAEGLATARQLAVNLVETLMQELQQTDFQQPQLTPPQMSMPPPPQHHIVATPHFSVEHPWLINTQNNQSGQIGGSNSQQQFQLQQVVLQPPPRPITHVNIPPPGVHIPQHAGPLVPPPQLVQLSAPPPSAPPVLVVSHPPPQPLYLPPDIVASSSIGTFSLVQGGLVYHQAPPVQTQAQIGDGQGQQNDGNNSMNPLSQPPPQMIITQVQLDHNNQIVNSNDQMSHSFQSNQKYHVIGHVQGQMNRDGNIQHQQQQQIIRQNQEGQNEIYSPYTQPSNANSSNMNSSYQSNMSGNNSDRDSDHDGPSQGRHNNVRHHNNPNMQQSDQESEKQGSRQMGRQDNQRGQINLPIPPNQNQNQSGSLSNNFQIAHNRSFPILGQLPPNRPPQPQQLSEGPPSNQSTNNQYLCQQVNNQNPQINHMSTSQEDSQIANSQQQTRQMPPNQFSDNNSQQQMDQAYNQQDGQQNQGNQHAPNQRNFNQSASNQNEPLSPRQDSRRNDGQGRNRSSRNRRGPRNTRQYVYPWSRSEQDNPNQQNDPVWLRKESIREFENERKMSDFPRGNSESRPSRFQPLEDEEVQPQTEDNRQSAQYKNNQDDDHNQQEGGARFNTSISLASTNQIVQHKTLPQQYGQGDNNQSTQVNRNRSDSDHHRKERSPDAGRKRRFEQENTWTNKSTAPKSSTSTDVGKSSHKKRFDQEDYKTATAGSQSSSKSPSRPIKPAESIKSEKSGSSCKWSDKKGDPSKKIEKPDRTESKKEERESKEKLSPKKMDGPKDKDNEASPQSAIAATKKPAPWSTEQRTEYKSNAVQYTNANQFQEQPTSVVSDNAVNRQYQQNYQPYLNAAQMFQGNLPYHLLPPPPPPPGQSQNANMQMQPGMQFNLPQGNANTPPNMLMGNNNMGHGFGQNPLGQQGMSSITQNMPPNMNPNVNHNNQYDMTQNMMSSMGHPMAPNNYILPPSMPPGMNQNSPLNIGQNIHQNMSPNMGQIMPNQLQGMPQNMGQNIPHNMGQHMMPTMGQSPSSYMGHNAPNMQHNMGQNAMNQNVNSNMGQNQNQMQPNMNQNMGQGLPSIMGNNSPNVNQNMAMNTNNNQNMGMNMQSMGQMPHNMVPSMVPPPSNILHGNSGPPPMMPPSMLNRTHMVPPPPPPNIHNITSQPPYPYWVN